MIYHVTHQLGGGTQKHIDDLIKLYPNETHKILNTTPFTINNVDKIKLVHIHSTMFGYHIGWDVLRLIDHLNQKHIPVYLTIHDYQWLFTINPAPTTEDFETIQPKEEDLKNCIELLHKVDKILIPSSRLYDNYKRYVKNMPDNKIFVVPHCDIPIRYKQLKIPTITESINIAFIGTPIIYKGIKHFFQLSNILEQYYDIPIKYYLFGGTTVIDKDNVIEKGPYQDATLIEQLHSNNIHILLSISTAEETYCYSLSQLINSGLPIVYFNRGALTTRLSTSHQSSRFFPVNSSNMLELQQQVIEAIKYVNTKPSDNYIEQSNQIILNDFYKNNYLPNE